MRWSSDVHHPADITITTIVFIPELTGYWEESLEVLERSLSSLLAATPRPFDLLVFDNGSCSEVRSYLQDLHRQGQIQFLLLSGTNLGKVGAWNFLFPAAPGEIIVYTDSDVLFEPGWLDESLAILRAFPKAGMITAQPARRGLPKYCTSTLEQAAANPEVRVERGNFIRQQDLDTIASGLGRAREEYEQLIAGQEDVRLERGGVQALVSADHFQFLTTRSALQRVGPLEVTGPLVPGDDQALDRRIDEEGLWRLSLPRPRVFHLGNRVSDGPGAALGAGRATGIDESRGPASSAARVRLSRSPRLRRWVKRLNSWTYRWLYPS